MATLPKRAEKPPIPQKVRLTAYYWRRGFVLAAPDFVLDRSKSPYRRLSVTLIFSLAAPFTIEVGDLPALEARAVLLGPKLPRRRIKAIGSDLIICDWSVASPEFEAMAPLLGGEPLVGIDVGKLAPLHDAFRSVLAGAAAADDLRALINQTIESLSGQRPHQPRLHQRIARALQLIQDRPLRAITPAWLAEQVHLSPSRLRKLFADEIGSNLTEYLRWIALWKATWLWTRGRPLVEIVEMVGLYDLAHLNRIFNEVFGLNPSDLYQPEDVRLIRCDWN